MPDRVGVTGWQGAIDDAWEHLVTGEPGHAAALVRQVIAHQPDAIDAYVVLAQTRTVPGEAIALFREAVLIGDRTVRGSIDEVGYAGFPYDRGAHVRALGDLARLLWTDARPHNREEALVLARRAFRMDPDDRAGTRLLLMAWEASAGNWAAARRITRRCRGEHRTEVRYWLALHAFRDGTSDADALRAKAITTNPHVIAALQGSLVSLRPPDGYHPCGSPDEASLYAADARTGWKATRGALAWLAAGMA